MTRLGNALFGRARLHARERDSRPSVGSSRDRLTGRVGVGPLIVVVLGAWGAGVAYFGPSIGLGSSGAPAWQWSTIHTVLNLLPGLATLTGGVIMAIGRLTARSALSRAAGGLAAAAAGWFVLGASTYPVLLGSPPADYARPGAGSLRNLAGVAGYGRGVGVAIGVLAGLALAQDARSRRWAADAADEAPIVPITMPEQPTAAPMAPGWRPQFRSTISRMVPRPVGLDQRTGDSRTPVGRTSRQFATVR